MPSNPADPGAPSFEVRTTNDVEPGERLLVGMAGPAVAGLTAADYLVSNVETTEIGHVRSRGLPDLTPFTAGVPRHPIRLYSTRDSDVTVLVSEVFLPVWVADPLADGLLAWADGAGISEITVMYGAPFPHEETEHVVFHVGTDEFRGRHPILAESVPDREGTSENGETPGRAAESMTSGEASSGGEDPTPGEIPPLAGGFFDGVIGELLVRSLDGDAPPTGVLITPTHLPDPDLDAAVRLLDGLETLYDVHVDEQDLEDRASEHRQYYEELTERMQALQEAGSPQPGTEYPNDRMFM